MVEDKSTAQLVREVRKISDPKFDGDSSHFSLWMKMLESKMKSHGVSEYLESAHLKGFSDEVGNSDNDKKLVLKAVNDHRAVMNVLRDRFLYLVPDSIKAKLFNQKPWQRSEAFAEVDFKDGLDEAAVLNEWGLDSVLDAQPHLSTMVAYMKVHYEANTPAQKQGLWRQLQEIKQKGNDFESMLSELQTKASEINASGQEVPEHLLQSIMYSALPKSAVPMITQLNTQNVNMDNSITQLRSYFKTQEAYANNGKKKQENTSESKVLDFTSTPSKPNKGKYCTKCRLRGHTVGTCWRLHPELRPETKEEQHGGNAPFLRGVKCYYCNKMGHRQDTCKKKQYDARKPNSKKKVRVVEVEDAAHDDAEDGNSPCVLQVRVSVAKDGSPPRHVQPIFKAIQLDSAADIHLSGDRSRFLSLQEMAPQEIYGVNEKKPALVATKQGAISFLATVNGKPKLRIVRDVKFVEGYPGTILSQGSLTKKGFSVVAEGCQGGRESNVLIFDNNKKLVLEGFQRPESTRTYIKLYGQTGELSPEQKAKALLTETAEEAHPSISSGPGATNPAVGQVAPVLTSVVSAQSSAP